MTVNASANDAPKVEIDRVAGIDNAGIAPLPQPLPAPTKTEVKAPRSAKAIAREALGVSAAIRGEEIYGAGIVVDRRGYVLTCEHVVRDMKTIEVSFPGTRAFRARVVDADPKLDVALLKVEVDEALPAAARAGGVHGLEVGAEIYSVGSPRRMDFTLSRGLVSFLGRSIEDLRMVQTDLPVNGGSSGGPVVNEYGEVVGMMTFKLRDSQGLAFALPIEYALERFADELGAPSLDLTAFHAWKASGAPHTR